MGLYLYFRNCISRTRYLLFDTERPKPTHLSVPPTTMHDSVSASVVGENLIVDFVKKHIWPAIKVEFTNSHINTIFTVP